jgi:phosphatidylserine/phosphatidylglycerophosphate/cardiolipin synthase-like enzyme
LLAALDAGRFSAPFDELSVRRYVGPHLAGELAAELARLVELGMTPALLRELLLLVDVEPRDESATLVWSGPEDAGAETRDTGVVLRELFARAERHVLIAGFAVYQGKEVFRVLAERMDELPDLTVEMFLNIERPYGDSTSADELLLRFATRFRDEQWPGHRLPTVYYDPRSIELLEPGEKRAALHAKCVVVDEAQAFITSANFTEAAQERNIEVGVLLNDRSIACALGAQFANLLARGQLRRLA